MTVKIEEKCFEGKNNILGDQKILIWYSVYFTYMRTRLLREQNTKGEVHEQCNNTVLSLPFLSHVLNHICTKCQ